MKAAAIAVGLFGMAATAQATVYKPGELVKDFVVDEDQGILTAPALSTDETLDNWAYGSYNDGNVIGYQDQRGWRAVFEIDAPAAGKYGVEVKLRTTTTNWMVAFNASQGLALDERASIEVAPAWTDMVRPTKISTVSKETVVVQEAQGNPEDEGYVPAITEEVITFASGEWETIYLPVTLKEGHNYVTFWLCRTYQGIDNLTGPEGSVNGVYVQSIKVMPQGSGDVADVLQKATLKLWQQRMYPTMITDESKNLSNDYASLMAAYATATDYSALSTTAVQSGIDAVTVREEDLRHGRGLILNSDSVAFALPYYHALTGGAISENERGEYSDAPMVFEYTNGKTLVYKFTTTVSGTYYPMLYAGTQLSTNAHVNILASDSITKLVNDWTLTPNTGAWQVYTMWKQPAISSFEAEAGQTYFLTIYFENYVNVRGLYLMQVVQNPKTYAELQDMQAQAEDLYAKYQPGTDGFYSIGGDAELIGRLEAALEQASELDENSTVGEITAAYYALEDAIAKIEGAKKMNVIPSSETNVFDLTNGTLTSWRIEAGGNIGYGYANGSAAYPVYNKQDSKYDIHLTASNGASDISIYSAYVDVDIDDENTVRVASVDFEFEGTGGWGNQTEIVIPGLAIPEGVVTVTLFGKQAASNNFVGNIYAMSVLPVAGTEGEGKKALDAAVAAYEALYTAENLQTLIEQARTAIAAYPYPEYDQTKVDSVKSAINTALAAIETGVLSARAKAYQLLEKRIADLPNSTKIVWQQIPSTDENPFDLKKGTFNRWQVEGGGNIGYGYANGSVLYYVDVTVADNYDIIMEVANPGDGGQMGIKVTADDSDEVYVDRVIDIPNTGSWNDHQNVLVNMALPQHRAKFLLYGVKASSSNWVGNIYDIKIQKASPEGITSVNTDNANSKGIYTLSGQYVGQDAQGLRKGIYVVGGRKVVVK